jgi:hypothetical protein
MWKSLSKDFYQVSWLNLVKVLEEHFIQISGGKRQFSTKVTPICHVDFNSKFLC